MKAKGVLSFLLLAILGLALLGMIFPQKGIVVAGKRLRFISPVEVIALDSTTKAQLKLKEQTSYLQKLNLKNKSDSLKIYQNFSKTSLSRIYYPQNNPSYFHTLFQSLDASTNNGTKVRIVHYGDSQLEMDRITDVFRHKIQQTFGGNGSGIIPAIQAIPSRTVSQYAQGNLSRHAINDSTRIGVNHRRYGMMGMFTALNGDATIHFKTTNAAPEKTKYFTTVKVVLKNNGSALTAKLKIGKNHLEPIQLKTTENKLNILTWNSPNPETRGVLSIKGNAEIYGISLEGNHGVVVDNIPLRGSSGDFFTGLDSLTLADGLNKMDTQLILLQFGGNAMPVIRDQKRVSYYANIMAKQIQHLKKLCPDTCIMYIGPGDMGIKINGKFQSRPFLAELNQALKEIALENGVAYWDLFYTMGGPNSMIEWVKAKPALATSDYTHYSQKGANLVGEMLFTAFYNDYQIYTLHKELTLLKDADSNKPKKTKG